MELLINRLNQYSFLEEMKPSDYTNSSLNHDGKRIWTDIQKAAMLLDEYATEITSLKHQLEQAIWQSAIYRDEHQRMEEVATANVDTAEEIYSAREKLKAAHEELEVQKEHLRRLSITDPLTGIYNRRYLMDQLADVHEEKSPRLSLLMIDIDHFKIVNDTYGHDAGDLALKSFAQLCKAATATGQTLARLGGEEFAIIMPNVGVRKAAELGEYIRQKTENLVIEVGCTRFSFTVSIGVSELLEGENSGSNLTIRADIAMYTAKNTGRNQVVICDIAAAYA